MMIIHKGMKEKNEVPDLLLVEYIVCETHVLTSQVNRFHSSLRRWLLSFHVG